MKVISVVPKQVVALLELTIDEVRMIRRVLAKATINFDGDDPQSVADKDYVVGEFFDALTRVEEHVGE